MSVQDHLAKLDWAKELAAILDGRYAKAEKVILVYDNLNTHGGSPATGLDKSRVTALKTNSTSSATCSGVCQSRLALLSLFADEDATRSGSRDQVGQTDHQPEQQQAPAATSRQRLPYIRCRSAA